MIMDYKQKFYKVLYYYFLFLLVISILGIIVCVISILFGNLFI